MRLVVGALSLMLVSCAESRPVGPTVSPNQQVTLAPGEAATIVDSRVRVQFVAVSADSRCPADVVCVRAGDATVQVRVFDGSTQTDDVLVSGDAARAAINRAGFRIELVRLEPYPFSSRPITPGDYRVTIKVTAA